MARRKSKEVEKFVVAQPRVYLQDLTANLGFAAPRLIEECRLLDKYKQAMNVAEQAYKILTEFSRPVTAYIVPYGFNRRLAISMNLREAFHFCSLRTNPQTHFSARHVALQVIEKIPGSSQIWRLIFGRPRLKSGNL